MLIASDVTPIVEIAARFALLTVFCVSLTLWIGFSEALYWLAGYALLEALNIGFLSTRRAPGTQFEALTATAINFLATFWFMALPVRLWQLDIDVLNFAAISLVVAMAMYSVTRYSGLRRIVIWDGMLIIGIVGYFGYDTAMVAQSSGAMVLTLVFTVLISIYFIVTLRESVRTRMALNEAEARNVQAEKMEAIGQLTGGIAHDFNNLLTVMIGNLDLYAEMTDPSEKDQLAEEARQAALRAATLTSHLLAFSRKARLNPQPLDPAQFLRKFAPLIQRLMPETVEVRLELASEIGSIIVDANQLENALLNLVINARDAIEGDGTITLRLEWVKSAPAQEFCGVSLAPGDFCRITVDDTGPGIAAELLNSVTEPFFTTKPVGKGSGLGLSMAKGFIEQSGGALDLFSVQGQGTAIAFWLPTGKTSKTA